MTDDQRSLRRSWTKIVIGPTMLAAEQAIGGYGLEGIKIRRQVSGLPYWQIVQNVYGRQGISGFYYGYFPWSLLQCLQGVPMLFTQHHVERFINSFGLSSNACAALGGVAGGFTMAFVVTPTGRLKTIAMTDPSFRGLNATSVLLTTVRKNGLSSIYNGFAPVCTKKSMDWGVRFGVADSVAQAVAFLSGKDSKDFGVLEQFLVGWSSGAISTVTTPVDVMIANAQRFRESGRRATIHELILDVYRQDGLIGFYRGLGMRMVHASYHTAWLYGGGKALFDWLDKLQFGDNS
eukprot:gnl/MRDRNA2_/MRDRNA2_78864_c0_seq1.p1 gnl/MRDRNA2_/MRDRNA2_78864_c0~~gnl/MRDRNA2_/MRDRNA2_78864_c0_seq1.p1  ORF type:complete len:291 (-),score=42.85 gnl/MRDRNA2_/MRDRNA2_78864_c0_seq1:63-935(-)